MQWFKDVVDAADVGEKSAIRALQAWQYLIVKAENRQIAQYDELVQLMEYPDARPIGSILKCIMHYCDQKNIPPLTLIVVNQQGIPGAGFITESLENYHKRREDVFNFPWLRLMPPLISELQAAREGV